MAELDMRTVIFGYIITGLISTLVMVMLWLQNRKRFPGTSFWVINFSCQTTGLILIALRGSIPDWVSIDLSNGLIMTGVLLGLIGLEQFVGRKRNHWHDYLIVAAYIFIHTWFTFAHPDLSIRTLNSAVVMLYFGLQICWLVFLRLPPDTKKMASGVGAAFVIFSLINFVRVVDFFATRHTATDYFHSKGFEAYVLIAYQIMFVFLTYNLALMFNMKLLYDIACEEEKFSKAFHSSPYAITINLLTDGRILEVNESFLKMTGFTQDEVLGKTAKEHHIWHHDHDLAAIVEELKNNGKVAGHEFQFRIKSGQIITCTFSAEIIMVKNEQCILSSLNDITQRKRTENQLRETLAYLESLLDYANAPIIVWDTDYRITKFNHAFERLTGRSFEDVAGKQLDLLFPERTKRISLDHIFRTAKGIRWETIEIDVQHVDGSLRTILWNSANVYDSDNKNIVATIAQGHDITERKAAEAQIVQLNAELEEQVSRRTAELHKTIADLEEQSRVFIGRELRIIELSKLVSQLESQLSGKTNQE